MNREQNIEHLIVGHLFGDLAEDEQAHFDRLVESGDIDAAEVDELRRSLSIASLHEAPEPPYGFWNSYYERVVSRAGQERERTAAARWQKWLAETRAGLSPRTRWATQLAFATVVLLLGVLLGRTILSPETDSRDEFASAPGAGEAVVPVAAQEYLGRSKTLLLGIVHASNGDAADLNMTRRKEMARELVLTAADIKPSLDNPDLRRLHELVSEIEMILIQIANLEAAHDVPAIEMVREGVERKALLFKINVEEMRRLEQAPPDDDRLQQNENTIRS